MKILSFIFLLCISSSVFGQEKKEVYYYDNGNIKEQGKMFNNVRTGKWQEYYKDYKGVLMFEGKYKKGQKQGKWKHYSVFGKLTYIEVYKDGEIVKIIPKQRYLINENRLETK